MIGLFSFDGPMYKDINGVYCNTTLTSELFERYLTVCDKLNVVIRTLTINSTYKEANLKEVKVKNVNFIEIGNLNSLSGMITERGKAIRIIEKEVKRADLIFARMPSIISDITIKFSRKFKKKYMVEVGGCAWDAYWNHSLKGKVLAPLVYVQEKRGVQNADYAVYVTEKWLQGRYPSKAIQTNASNVYLDEINEKVLQKRLKKIKTPRTRQEFILGTTAAVDVSYKGQQFVIRALAKLKKEGYKFKYQMVGKGNPEKLLKLAKELNVEDSIEFKGVLVHDDVFEWLDSIDIYIQPSKQEGLPRALVEALSRACPALGSRTAGIPELLNNDFIFSKGNVDEICEILKKMINTDLTITSIENFSKSKEFNLEILNYKRNKIYKMYRDEILNGKEVKNNASKNQKVIS